MKKHRGLKFEKFDLHVHTPASSDFAEREVTAEQIVGQALSKGLRGIAITDHNTGAFIDDVQAAAKGRNLVVFPGVEICCSGGKSGIHIVALLDVTKDSNHIKQLLHAVGIDEDQIGDIEAVSAKSVHDVIGIIASSPHDGIAVLAHSSSSKGVLHDITGKTRQKVFKQQGLLAVETSEEDFKSPKKTETRTRVIDLLEGTDPNYCNRRPAVYIASDSREKPDSATHTLSGIGARWTFLKVDDQPDLESLRQCFIDRDTRVLQFFEQLSTSYPRILQMKVEGGFFDGQEFQFHEGLNSILGAKGAGKSLLIELLRFGLGHPPEQQAILDDHARKLERRLLTYGRVHLLVIDETGTEYHIARTYDPANGSPYAEEQEQDIAEAFGAVFLSQNEIVKVAENERLQIAFIDKFFDFRSYRDQIAALQSKIAALDKRFADGIRAMHTLQDVKTQLKRRQIRLAQLDKAMKDETYERFKKVDTQNRALRYQLLAVEELAADLREYAEHLDSIDQPEVDESVRDAPAVKRVSKAVRDAIALAKDRIAQTIEAIREAKKQLDAEYEIWSKTYIVEKKKYQEYVLAAGGEKKDLEKKRLDLSKQVAELEKQERTLESKREALRRVNEERKKRINDLLEIHKAYSHERKLKCQKFESESGGRLRVRLHESSNRSEFEVALTSMKRGSYLRGAEIEQISERISPQTDIETEHLGVLLDFLLGQVEYEELLSLQYRVHPEDRPEIRFRVASGNYELIRDVSVGQKCTAMLIMALAEGRFPVVIDQPEDSLDIRSVWDDMCVKLRGTKDDRQFVFTTHNSCLAVASDTDKYIVLEGDNDRGTVVLTGALELRAVRSEVIQYLEGGPKTYRRKAEKYGALSEG
jgi:ABC-type multidrug transport system ATPase subunit